MKRTIVAISKALLPEFIKSILRQRLMDSSVVQPPPDLPFHLAVVGETGQASIDGYPSIQTTAASQFDFEHLFHSDWQEFNLFLKVADSAKCFFDIGASRGVFSVVFANMQPSHVVYAFEASTRSCSSMEELLDANRLSAQINVVNTFVGDKTGTIMASQEECGYVQAVPVSSERMVSVPMCSVDDFCVGISDNPDLLKIDVEGFEHEVLLGAQRLLKAQKPIILLELHLFYLENRGIDPRETLAILENASYLLYDMSGRLKSAGQHVNTFARTIKLLAVHADVPLPSLLADGFSLAKI
jgi:FkbM family methyltransferase